MSLALIVPFGLVIFNLIATMLGGIAADARAAALRPRRDLGDLDRPRRRDLAVDGRRRLAPAQHHRRHRGDPLRPDRRRRLRRLRRPALLVPEADRAHDGRDPGARSPSGRWRSARCVTFVPLFIAGSDHGEVVDAYKFFDGNGVSAENLIATIGAFVLAIGILLTLVNAIVSLKGGGARRPRPVGRRLARVVRALAAGAAQLRRAARRAQRPADARHPRRDRAPHRGAPKQSAHAETQPVA